ncbi:MAG: circularly permuted type 2 ATP-grasp protein [Deltaproteobacteria bacterium]|nr:circularly permuted type 2 ATP-grasp protein [Deltaproteobacteria bacterium]
MNLNNYLSDRNYDELFMANGSPRPCSSNLIKKIKEYTSRQLQNKQKIADRIFFREGVTFNVYGDKKGSEKIFPFDLIPRVLEYQEWNLLKNGLIQRMKALNCFLQDIYSSKHILNHKIVPEDLILKADSFRKICEGLEPANGIWINICGSDIIRDQNGHFLVLEDNLRCPSGVSYVIENRNIMKRVFPEIFSSANVLPVEDYADHLRQILLESSFRKCSDSRVVLLTPGPYNSAYFEHAFLAQKMGIELVEPGDLFADKDCLKIRTTSGFERVDVVYRRIDDDFIDPLVFRKDSLLGVPGIFELFKKKKVSLVNSPGTGIADDKAVYPYVPDMIKFYLKEEPILHNVKTYKCTDPRDREFVLENMAALVVKAVNLSGGYGILIGNKATQDELHSFRKAIQKNPREYIAQPIIQLSTAPTLRGKNIEPRHIDLRPFALSARSNYVTPGGLTRVALKEGSLIVNSSQGGGSKDTWILAH